jgi:membrane fusion protein (multidrug efflux system)
MTYLTNTRARIALTVIVLAGLAVSTGCRRESEAAAAEAEKNAGMTIGPENIAIVAPGSLMSGPAISGTLTPEREATTRAQIGGSVLQTYAEAGQSVRAGQLLVAIDATGVQDAFLSARAAVTAASNNADIAARELGRSQKLLAAGAIAEREIEQVRRNAISANAALADARARLASAQRQLSNTRVVAPFSGIVSDRPVSAGDVVQVGTALVTVVDPSSMRLEASVPSDQLGSVRIGVPVTFTITGYPGREITGRVTRVNPTADPATRQVRIMVSIPNTEGRLVGGLYANGRLASESHTGLVAPLSAIDARSGTAAVLRIKQGRVERVPVQLGLRDEGAEKIELLSGVQAGDTLLLGAAQGITPGTVLRVSAPSDNPVTVTKEKR